MARLPTAQDWGRIHAKAWTDPEFRKLLESDPTAAVRKYAEEHGRVFDKLMRVRKQPNSLSVDYLDSVVKGEKTHSEVAPSCC